MRRRLLLAAVEEAGCGQHITVEEQPPRAEWEARAAKAHAKGIKQRRCMTCKVWFWPWEWRKEAKPTILRLPEGHPLLPDGPPADETGGPE